MNQFDTFQTPGKPGASEPNFEIQRSLRRTRGRKVLIFLTRNLVLLVVETMQSKVKRMDFHGSPVVNTPRFQCKRDRSSVSGRRTKIPCVMWHGQFFFFLMSRDAPLFLVEEKKVTKEYLVYVFTFCNEAALSCL